MNNEFENNIHPEEDERLKTPSFADLVNPESTPATNPPESAYTNTIPKEPDSTAEPVVKSAIPVTEPVEKRVAPSPAPEKKIPEFKVTHTVKKGKNAWARLVAMSIVGGILFGATFGLASGFANRLTVRKVNIEPTKVTLNKEPSDIAGTSNVAVIAEECMPSIVAITNHSVSDVITFFGTYQQESTSSGSGIIIGKNDTELLIVTNYHVVAKTKELSVVFSPVEKRLEEQNSQNKVTDEDIPHAIVKGYDTNKDLAVIAVKLDDIPADVLSQIKIATIGDSSALKPGDQVVAIGNSLGYGQSVTTGIISAVNREITMESADGYSVVTNSFIQTDAAINSGNSGGALLDMEGKLIGINSVKIATTGVEGMGYAIPITDVEEIIDDLMVRQTRDLVAEHKQGFLGIVGADVDASDREAFGMPVGVFISDVTKGLAAEKAGIKKGYIITKFDGYTITTIAQLQERLLYYEEGEKVIVTVMIPEEDEYTEKEIEVTLSNRMENINR
ncbi:MAG: trypsin-like serine protease [Ruminococcaceae bacterium]|nr:trypsin-like serine protease [Oscillospiraceae bacterium]